MPSLPCYLKCMSQVEKMKRKLKHKLWPYNAYFKAKGLECPHACPLEELHPFLIGLYGDYVIPSTLYEYDKVLRRPDLVLSKPGSQITQFGQQQHAGWCVGTACHLYGRFVILNGTSYWTVCCSLFMTCTWTNTRESIWLEIGSESFCWHLPFFFGTLPLKKWMACYAGCYILSYIWHHLG